MLRGFKFDASKSNTIYGSSATVQPPATEMYLYFSSGIENDVVGGGVIDGSKYLLSNDSIEYITDVTIDTTGTLLYTVENDCQLYIETPCKEQIIWNRLYVYINDVDNPIWSLNDSHAGFIYKSTTIPIKSGSKIYAKFLNSDSTVSNCAIKFIEYKLNSLNPQLAFPDWNESKAVTINNGDTIHNNGWIVFQVDDSTMMGNTYSGRAYINGIEVYYWSWETDGDNNTNTSTVPVCKGDVLTYTDASGRMSCTFYPAKSVPVTKSEKADLEQKITELSGTVADTYLSATTFDTWKANDYATAMSDKADASQLPSKQDVIVQEGYLYVPDRDVDGRWHRMQAYYDSDMEGVTTTCGDENYVRDAGGNFILEA